MKIFVSKTLLPLAMASGLYAASSLAAEEAPMLERYWIGHGGAVLSDAGFTARLNDSEVGNGYAKAQIDFAAKTNKGELKLKVWRNKKRNAPALLIDRVEIRTYDVDGLEIGNATYLSGFTFGDSQRGNWHDKIQLPKGTPRISVALFGQYN